MNILGIDTATEILSIALWCDYEPEAQRADRPAATRIFEEIRDVGLRHTQTLMPLVDRLLGDAGLTPSDLDLVACTRGPGSFTGLRIGMSTAKGLGAAVRQLRGLERSPVVSVSTLDVMAGAVPETAGIVVPVIDGRKNRFYAAVFSDGRRVCGDLDLDAPAVLETVRSLRAKEPDSSPERITITGPHADVFLSRVPDPARLAIDPAFRRGNAPGLVPLAVRAFLSDGPDAPSQGPVYVRDSDAELSLR